MMSDYALETLAAPTRVLVIYEIGFPKQGSRSCSVGRQYNGSTARSPNAR
jgi:SRSO17 transposase